MNAGSLWHQIAETVAMTSYLYEADDCREVLNDKYRSIEHLPFDLVYMICCFILFWSEKGIYCNMLWSSFDYTNWWHRWVFFSVYSFLISAWAKYEPVNSLMCFCFSVMFLVLASFCFFHGCARPWFVCSVDMDVRLDDVVMQECPGMQMCTDDSFFILLLSIAIAFGWACVNGGEIRFSGYQQQQQKGLWDCSCWWECFGRHAFLCT